MTGMAENVAAALRICSGQTLSLRVVFVLLLKPDFVFEIDLQLEPRDFQRNFRGKGFIARNGAAGNGLGDCMLYFTLRTHADHF